MPWQALDEANFRVSALGVLEPMLTGARWGAIVGCTLMAFRILSQSLGARPVSLGRVLAGTVLGLFAGLIAPLLLAFWVDFREVVLHDPFNEVNMRHLSIVALHGAGWGALLGTLAVGFAETARGIGSSRPSDEGGQTMKPILLGTLIGFVSGIGFVDSWIISFEKMRFTSQPLEFFWVMGELGRAEHVYAVIQGAGWGALIGTVVAGFHQMTRAVHFLRAAQQLHVTGEGNRPQGHEIVKAAMDRPPESR